VALGSFSLNPLQYRSFNLQRSQINCEQGVCGLHPHAGVSPLQILKDYRCNSLLLLGWLLKFLLLENFNLCE
jgi:hypothetical protein